MKYVNCGCGNKYVIDEEWINIDFNAISTDVIAHNIVKGLPFENESIDAIFSSCMLEHFTREEAKHFILECYRSLRVGGIVRIVVPDLENICKEYLAILEAVRKDGNIKKKYEYIVIELLDQMSRSISGGEMQKYWNDDTKDEKYILERTGYPENSIQGNVRLKTKIRIAMGMIYSAIFGRMKWFKTWKMGKFVMSGELHKWMYDSYSLSELLRENGFGDIVVLSCNNSKIKDWNKYRLELDKSDNEYKPNSLYIEATKLQ